MLRQHRRLVTWEPSRVKCSPTGWSWRWGGAIAGRMLGSGVADATKNLLPDLEIGGWRLANALNAVKNQLIGGVKLRKILSCNKNYKANI